MPGTTGGVSIKAKSGGISIKTNSDTIRYYVIRDAVGEVENLYKAKIIWHYHERVSEISKAEFETYREFGIEEVF